MFQRENGIGAGTYLIFSIPFLLIISYKKLSIIFVINNILLSLKLITWFTVVLRVGVRKALVISWNLLQVNLGL